MLTCCFTARCISFLRLSQKAILWLDMCGFVAILGTDPTLHSAGQETSARFNCTSGSGRRRRMAGRRHIHLGHRRLSIIDLATGDQPMESWDGRYVIVFNGEIYNFPELRELLSANGATFRTRSDTEVILEAYRRWGRGRCRAPAWHVRICDLGSSAWLGLRRTGSHRHQTALLGGRSGGLMLASTLEPFSLIESFREHRLRIRSRSHGL